MTAFKELSKFFSEDNTRESIIKKELGTNNFIVSVKNDSGHWFSATYENEEDAEAFAEDWVLQ